MSRRPLAVVAFAIASLALAACSDASVTEPTSRLAPQSARHNSGDTGTTQTCLSGWTWDQGINGCVQNP